MCAICKPVQSPATPDASLVMGLSQRFGSARRIAVGELRPHDPEVAARSLLYTVQMLHMTREAADNFIPEMVDNLLLGIKPR